MIDSSTSSDVAKELTSLRSRVAGLEAALRSQEKTLSRSRVQTELMSALLAATDPSNQDDIFHAMVYHLAAALHVSHAVIGAFHLDGDQKAVETIAVLAHGEFLPNFTYPLDGTPCAELLHERVLNCEARVQERFPDAPLMKTVGAEGYCGFTLYGPGRQPIGVLAVLDTKPLAIPDDLHPLLMLYGARAAAELKRQRAETARREAERRLRFTQFAVDHAVDGVLWANESKRLVYANEAVCRFLGYSLEELLAFRIPDIAPYTDVPVQERPDGTGQGASATYETVHRRKDGTEFPVELSVTALEHDGKRYTCAIVRDISDRKRDEEAWLQALFDLQNITETIPDIMLTLDCQGKLIKWNSRVAAVTGYSVEELRNRPALAFVPAAERERTAAAIHQALTTGYAELDGHLLTKDQRLIPYHWTGAV
ncbi:MAG TPA: PAS domain S-box protein, partial [Nitrospira sp.]|nr:PAS domain S-box protein [Nitrospira sp.]